MPIIRELLEEGHYVGVVTNGTLTKNIESLMKFPDELRKRIFLKFSFYYGELKRIGRLQEFFATVKKCKKSGISFTIELPAYDEFVEDESIIEVCTNEVGAAPHVATLRDESQEGFALMSQYSFAELKEKWKHYQSELFEIRSEVMEKKYKGFCYAGAWTFTANLESGEVRQCHYERVIGNLYDKKPIDLVAVGSHCHSEYCYVCHAFLTLGDIPKLKLNLRYDEVRDRKSAGWLNDEMRNFMHQRLYENNAQYSFIRKWAINEKNRKAELASWKSPVDFSNQIMINMKNCSKKDNYVLTEARHSARIIYKKIPKELVWIYNIYKPEDEKDGITGTPIICLTNGKQSENAMGNEIWIVGALIDNVFYDAEDIFDCTWMKRMRMIGWCSYGKHIGMSVQGRIPKGKHITLVMEKNKWRGICSIVYEDKTIDIDTYGDCDDGIMYIRIK